MIWGVSALLYNSVSFPRQPQSPPASAHGREGGAADYNIPRLFGGTFKGRNVAFMERLVTMYCIRSQENIVMFVPSSSPSQQQFGVKSPLSFRDFLYRKKIEMKAGE